MWSFVYPSPLSTVSGTVGGLRNRVRHRGSPARVPVDRRANENLLKLQYCTVLLLTKFMFWAVETWILVASAWALAVPPAWYACCGICVKVLTHTYVTTTLPHCS